MARNSVPPKMEATPPTMPPPTCLNCGNIIIPKPKTHRPQKFCHSNCRKEAWKHGGGARVQKWMREKIAKVEATLESQEDRIRDLEIDRDYLMGQVRETRK